MEMTGYTGEGTLVFMDTAGIEEKKISFILHTDQDVYLDQAMQAIAQTIAERVLGEYNQG